MRVGLVAVVTLAVAALSGRAMAQAPGDQQPSPAFPPASMQSAHDAYWAAVRASTGPIGFPRNMGGGQPPPPPIFVGGGPILAPAAGPTYVPIYVPGPVVYIQAPPAPPVQTPVPGPPVNPAPRTPQKFYVIPGCYGGNVTPVPSALPPGCDLAGLQTYTW